MHPITKVWQCELKDAQSIDSPEFSTLISAIFSLTSSHTNPHHETGIPEMHVLYFDVKVPTRLLMITGYQSQELNSEADAVYAAKFLPQMFEFVSHRSLKQLDLDVRDLSLGENLQFSYGKDPDQWAGQTKTKSIGGWDVWPQTTQGQKMRAASGQEGPEEKVWVQFASWDGQSDESSSSGPLNGETIFLKRFMGR